AGLSITTSDLGNTGSGGVRTDNDVVTVTFTPVNDPPTAVNDSVTLAEDAPATAIPVLANDSSAPDGAQGLTVVQVTQGAHGIVTGGGTQVFYTPNPNYFGPDSFGYTISDGNGGVASATVSVTVTPVNDPPTAVNDAFSVGEGSTNNNLPVL